MIAGGGIFRGRISSFSGEAASCSQGGMFRGGIRLFLSEAVSCSPGEMSCCGIWLFLSEAVSCPAGGDVRGRALNSAWARWRGRQSSVSTIVEKG